MLQQQAHTQGTSKHDAQTRCTERHLSQAPLSFLHTLTWVHFRLIPRLPTHVRMVVLLVSKKEIIPLSCPALIPSLSPEQSQHTTCFSDLRSSERVPFLKASSSTPIHPIKSTPQPVLQSKRLWWSGVQQSQRHMEGEQAASANNGRTSIHGDYGPSRCMVMVSLRFGFQLPLHLFFTPSFLGRSSQTWWHVCPC